MMFWFMDLLQGGKCRLHKCLAKQGERRSTKGANKVGAPRISSAPSIRRLCEPIVASRSLTLIMTQSTPENPSATPADSSVPAASSSPCADAAPGSHVEAACEGPTADNPSLSIKKRIKRAQFFDQREQLAAAGLAVPVEADAGLPDALADPASER
jgi:hypothetical protein